MKTLLCLAVFSLINVRFVFGDIPSPDEYLGLPKYNEDSNGLITNSICGLEIRVDSYLWEHIKKKITSNDRAYLSSVDVDLRVRHEITSLVAEHVEAANAVFNETDFRAQLRIKFRIFRLTINDDNCTTNNNDTGVDPICNKSLSADDYLKVYSNRSHDGFCLSYTFTYRDFKGVLGNSYPTSLDRDPGSACEIYRSHGQDRNSSNWRPMQARNVGVVSFYDGATEITTDVSKIVFIRELGRSFGAQLGAEPCDVFHVRQPMLSPQKNISPAHFFSSCAVKNMTGLLKALELHYAPNCLYDEVDIGEGFCGNNIVEPGEECDCGLNDEDCKENCCYPRLISSKDLERNATAKGCTRRANAQCSPSEGPCCDAQTCQLVATISKKSCRNPTDCQKLSFCTATSAECPETNVPDGIQCQTGTQTCFKGQCGSKCAEWRMIDCTKGDDRRHLCHLACASSVDLTCFSGDELPDSTHNSQYKQPGSLCDNNLGYCDQSFTCRSLDYGDSLSILPSKAPSLIFRNNLLALVSLPLVAIYLN